MPIQTIEVWGQISFGVWKNYMDSFIPVTLNLVEELSLSQIYFQL